MYPFVTLNDGTEIVHSELKEINGKKQVKVYIETPSETDCFHHATYYLPEYRWEDISGYSEEEMKYFVDFIESTAHLIMEFAADGGFENASNF